MMPRDFKYKGSNIEASIVIHSPCGFGQPDQVHKFSAVAESVLSPDNFGKSDDVVESKASHIGITPEQLPEIVCKRFHGIYDSNF